MPRGRITDGLSLSSRNTRLTDAQRRNAPKIAETLFKSRTFAASHSVKETIDEVVNTLNAIPEMRVEYYEIVDGNTLQPVTDWNDSDYNGGCITVYDGEVRLIDNIAYRRPEK